MQAVARGIYYEDGYTGVTLGALAFPHGIILIDAPLRTEDARAWRVALNSLPSGPNRILVNLDAHLDRTIGARALDCTIVAHQKTGLEQDGRIVNGNGADTDIICTSAKAYLNALNKLHGGALRLNPQLAI